jgi:hypothetical protein
MILKSGVIKTQFSCPTSSVKIWKIFLTRLKSGLEFLVGNCRRKVQIQTQILWNFMSLLFRNPVTRMCAARRTKLSRPIPILGVFTDEPANIAPRLSRPKTPFLPALVQIHMPDNWDCTITGPPMYVELCSREGQDDANPSFF